MRIPRQKDTTRLVSGLLVGLLVTTTCSGCYSTWDVPHAQLAQLHGFREPEKRRVLDDEGRKAFVFDRQTELRFYNGSEGARVLLESGRFVAIDVAGPILIGTREGEKVHINLAKITGIEATGYSRGKTAGLVVGLVLGAFTAAFVVALVVGLDK